MKLLVCFTMVSLFAGSALAQTVHLSSGQWQNIHGVTVTCNGGGPIDPPAPAPIEYVRVRMVANVGCLQGIPATDGRDTARRASACDSSNQSRLIGLKNCVITSSRTDHNLSESIIARATTVIYESQKEIVRTAASDRVYECQR